MRCGAAGGENRFVSKEMVLQVGAKVSRATVDGVARRCASKLSACQV
jgi:hypothetical protein